MGQPVIAGARICAQIHLAPKSKPVSTPPQQRHLGGWKPHPKLPGGPLCGWGSRASVRKVDRFKTHSLGESLGVLTQMSTSAGKSLPAGAPSPLSSESPRA